MALKLKANNANLNLKTNIGQLIKGDDGGYYIPSIDGEGNLTWTASEADMPEIVGANILGPEGESGVYVGTTEPIDDSLIWINPEGQGIAGDAIATKEYVNNAINAALAGIANAEDGAY